ncbi:Outer envelope protein 80 [Citrus sinensis]|uniref:Outer envelope protein 80 n=1 Tax=Citrus sinensis TaxID=2711 RepID=A0ACB8MW89_CITSI|nr:Outer envelope protein 80 [Citrus sinensis]
MAQKNDDARFTSSPLKIPRFQPQPPLPFFAETLTESKNSLSHQIHSLRTRSDESTQSTELTQPESLTRKLQLFAERAYGNSARVCSMYPSTTGAGETLVNLPLLCSAWMSLSQSTTSESAALPEVSSTQLQQKAQQQPHSVSRSDEERVLISEVLVRNKDGEELERKYLGTEALTVLKACHANSALTVREVQEDVNRIIDGGYFCSCRAKSRVSRDGKIINIRRLDEVITSINGWYMEHGLFGLVSGVEILSGGVIRLQVAEAEVNNISIRFLDRKTGEPTKGKTRPETILRQLTTKKGQVYSMLQGKRDVETVLTMGIMEDVSIIPQPAGDVARVPKELVFGEFLPFGNISKNVLVLMMKKEILLSRISIAVLFTGSGKTHDDVLIAKFESVYTGSGNHGSSMFVFDMEQGLPVLPKWLFFNRVNAHARKGVDISHARLRLNLSGGHVIGNFYPHEAFAIGGTNSVRGYEEGAVGSGRSYVVGSGEITFPMLWENDSAGVDLVNWGQQKELSFLTMEQNLDQALLCPPGDPAGARLKPGSGYGHGFGIRVDSPLGPLGLEYAFNDRQTRRFHFGVGHPN